MKKIISLIIFVLLAFALSVFVFAAEEPQRLFIVSEEDGFSAEEIYSFAIEKGFSGVLVDARKSNSADFLWDYISPMGFQPIEIFTFADKKHFESLEAGRNVVVSNEISEEVLASLSEKLGSENLAFFLPFGDENAAAAAEYFFGKGYFKTLFAENLLSCYSEYGYEEYLLDLSEKFSGAKIISVNDLGKVLSPTVKGDFYGNAFELNNQYLVNKINGFGFCVSDYDELLRNRNGSAGFLMDIFGSTVLDEYADFSVSQKLAVTRPAGSSLKIETADFTIFGTSDPEKPLYLDGEEITRISTTGLFAVNVDVPKKGKTFTFSQGGKSVSVKLTRSGGSSGGVAATTKLTSCQPAGAVAVKTGDMQVTLSCVGPSGGKVSAKIGEKTFELKQVAYADPGVPAKFTAKVNLPGDYPENEVTFIGKVTYTLRYNGNRRDFESTEGYYYVGENAAFAIRASVNLAGVEREPYQNGDYLTTLRAGCADYVYETAESGWYKLSNGGYINPDQCTIVTGNTDITAKPVKTGFTVGENYEMLTFKSENIPAFDGKIHEKALSLTLYNTELEDFSSINLDSELMRRIVAVDNGDGSITLNFYSNKKLWGWDFFTDPEKGEFSVVLKPAPKLSDDPAKPLSGITVTVCAGHGGIDPGALSVAGEEGVNEAQINKANMLSIAEALENLGAKIVLLYTDEGKLETYGRTDPAREAFSDVYICCHANSIPENGAANLICGTKVYYHYEHSAEFSQMLTDYISAATGRDNEGSHQDYYSVTRLTMCPAVMLEVGYISNPKELESLIDQRDIRKTAHAVAKAVLEICDN